MVPVSADATFLAPSVSGSVVSEDELLAEELMLPEELSLSEELLPLSEELCEELDDPLEESPG